jgi:hypothetical protein
MGKLTLSGLRLMLIRVMAIERCHWQPVASDN